MVLKQEIILQRLIRYQVLFASICAWPILLSGCSDIEKPEKTKFVKKSAPITEEEPTDANNTQNNPPVRDPNAVNNELEEIQPNSGESTEQPNLDELNQDPNQNINPDPNQNINPDPNSDNPPADGDPNVTNPGTVDPTIPEPDLDFLRLLVKQAGQCTDVNGFGPLSACLSSSILGVQTSEQKFFEWVPSGDETLTGTVLVTAKEETLVGVLGLGLGANIAFDAKLINGNCPQATPVVYQHYPNNTDVIISEIKFNFSTDANGNALVYSVGNFSVQGKQVAIHLQSSETTFCIPLKAE